MMRAFTVEIHPRVIPVCTNTHIKRRFVQFIVASGLDLSAMQECAGGHRWVEWIAGTSAPNTADVRV